MSLLDEAAWDGFVDDHPAASFFHRSAWRHVARDVFGHHAHYLSIQRGDRVAAILPLVEVRSRLFGKTLISNAFCVGGGPLATDESAFAAIVERAEELGRRLGVDYVELRDTPQAPAGWLARDDLYFGFAKAISVDENVNLMAIPRRQRAVLRKAMGQDLEASVERSADAFFPLYARNMRDHGTPALPRRFFDRLLATFGPDCEIMTVRRAGRPVSSVLSYFFRGRVMPYYTGSALEARELGSNDYMYWMLMRRALARGCGVFDFGRSKAGTGPYAFKRNWGFEPRPIVHQYRMLNSGERPEMNPTNPKYAALIQAWRRLPLPVATAVSPLLSRSLA